MSAGHVLKESGYRILNVLSHVLQTRETLLYLLIILAARVVRSGSKYLFVDLQSYLGQLGQTVRVRYGQQEVLRAGHTIFAQIEYGLIYVVRIGQIVQRDLQQMIGQYFAQQIAQRETIEIVRRQKTVADYFAKLLQELVLAFARIVGDVIAANVLLQLGL
jgi:hypothetical protein